MQTATFCGIAKGLITKDMTEALANPYCELLTGRHNIPVKRDQFNGVNIEYMHTYI